MTTDLREYRPGSHHAADLALVGYEVEATDGPLGRVEQDAGDHLLVDSRPWVPGAPVLVPIAAVARVDHLELVVHLDCPRARVRIAPPPAAVELTAYGAAAADLTAYGPAAADRADRSGARPGS
ncbi:hypothetical protein [Kitasatospora purpeofusca]|uniref:hypothetical protein n=1 Tax=Kitasatospora purpeofusca TaxID=67352 RepID=UPI002A5AF049|nr:hypothetical protein [Kitasatospora purpeofusca]MDY0813348.1 hypothetical protein [Kitasatospora purpeofusca]